VPALELVVGLAILVGVAIVASGRAGAAQPAEPDRAPLDLPADRPLAAGDLARVRFSVGFRGYRMDQVDAVLDRIEAEWRSRDSGADPTPERTAEQTE
jgi:DivIVA domain-containing protein